MFKKIASFWQNYKKSIVLVIGLTVAAPYLPVLVPLVDTVTEEVLEASESQPGESQGG